MPITKKQNAAGEPNSTTALAEKQDAGDERCPVIVAGGGISGLALAVWLRQSGVRALVLEKAERPGGVIGTVDKEGFIFETGPNTVLDKSDAFGELLSLAGLESEAHRSPLKDHARYIWRDGRLHPAPTGPGALFRHRLLSWRGKLRLLREPWVAPVREDEPLKEFTLRRLGPEAYHRLMEPFVMGLGSTDPALMSAAASFPLLKALETDSGSLIRGFIKRMKEKRRSRPDGAPPRPRQLVSFKGGLARLPEALARSLGDACRPGVEVQSVEPLGGANEFRVKTLEGGRSTTLETERVALCAEAATVAGWIESFEPDLAERMRAIHYCPLVVIGLGVRTEGLRLPPGFGFLTVRGEGLRILGVIFNSNFLPDRAPPGCAALTVMIGGDLDPDAIHLTDEELLDLALRDLTTALAWAGSPLCHHIRRWPKAIPRYGMDHPETVRAIEDVERRHPGLCLFGAWRDGTSLGDRVDQARTTAATLGSRESGAR